jgi:hypothetical protein
MNARTLLLPSILASYCSVAVGGDPLKVGSKPFTESCILGEVLVRTAGRAIHKPGLGNTGVLHATLLSGAIDIYPEYTGTILREILKQDGQPTLVEIDAALAPHAFWRAHFQTERPGLSSETLGQSAPDHVAAAARAMPPAQIQATA